MDDLGEMGDENDLLNYDDLLEEFTPEPAKSENNENDEGSAYDTRSEISSASDEDYETRSEANSSISSLSLPVSSPSKKHKEYHYNKRQYDDDFSIKNCAYQSKLRYILFNARFFLMKSNNADNIEISKSKNVWSTLPSSESKLNEAYKECKNVILVFSVQKSGKFSGFARLLSDSRRDVDPVPWVLPKGFDPTLLEGVFKIDWICKKELAFNATNHLHNAFNEYKQVKLGRDGQEIDSKSGQKLCKLFPEDESIDLIPILENCKQSGKRFSESDLQKSEDYMRRSQSSRGRFPFKGRNPRFFHKHGGYSVPHELNSTYPGYEHVVSNPYIDYYPAVYNSPSYTGSPYYNKEYYHKYPTSRGGGRYRSRFSPYYRGRR